LRFAPFERAWVEESIRLGKEFGFYASYHQRDLISINGFNDGVQKFYDSFNSPVPPFLSNDEIDKDHILSIIPFVHEDMMIFCVRHCRIVRRFAGTLIPWTWHQNLVVKTLACDLPGPLQLESRGLPGNWRRRQ
jgi:hypothetical protein